MKATTGQALDSFDDPEATTGLMERPPMRSRYEDRPTYDVEQTAAEFRTHFADLQPGDLLLAGATAHNHHEVDQVALLSVVLFDHATAMTPVALPDGRVVGSLHDHITRWRSRPGGFVDPQTASDPTSRGRTPLHL